MDSNIFYMTLDLTNAIIISIILFYSIKKKQKSKAGNEYTILTGTTVCCLLMDLLCWLFGQDSSPTSFLLNTLNFLLLPAVILFFVLYMEAFIEKTNKQFKTHMALCCIPVLLMMLNVIVNSFTGKLFYFDSAGYHRGPFYMVHLAISGFLVFYVIIRSLVESIRNKNKKNRAELRLVCLGMLFIFAAAVLQALYYGVPFIWQAMTIFLVFIFVRIQKDSVEEIKTDFFARMSHDLKTPLNGIIGLSTIAMNSLDDRAITMEYLTRIQNSGKFMLKIVNYILALEKLEDGDNDLNEEPWLYEEYSREIYDMFKDTCREDNIGFTVDMQELKYDLLVDKIRLKQILINLISNAVNFTESGDWIKVSASARNLDENNIMATFIVANKCIGIPEEAQKHMYDVYSQDTSSNLMVNKGVGMSLAVVKSFIDMMGGTIYCDSKLNDVTTFTIRLPIKILREVKEEPVQIKNDASPSKDSDIIKGKRILLVEDHIINTIVATELLKNKSALIETAENGKIALEIFANSASGYYSLILMDMMMPIMGGIEATKKIRELNRPDAKTIPILAMTANSSDEDIEKSLESGMNDHISKPIIAENFYAALEKWL